MRACNGFDRGTKVFVASVGHLTTKKKIDAERRPVALAA